MRFAASAIASVISFNCSIFSVQYFRRYLEIDVAQNGSAIHIALMCLHEYPRRRGFLIFGYTTFSDPNAAYPFRTARY